MSEMTTADLKSLDPGIRETVKWVRLRGFDTTDSGDGVTKIAAGLTFEDGVLDVPHVVIRCTPTSLVEDARRLRAALSLWLDRAVEPNTVEATYDPANDVAVIMLMGINDDVLLANHRAHRHRRDDHTGACIECGAMHYLGGWGAPQRPVSAPRRGGAP